VVDAGLPSGAGGPARRQDQLSGLEVRDRKEVVVTLKVNFDNNGSLRSLGEAEGITVSRVGLVLDLLTLAPEILAAIDVPAGRAPKVTQAELRAIAKVREKGAQIARFDELRGALAAK
jgi:hypothetical protein